MGPQRDREEQRARGSGPPESAEEQGLQDRQVTETTADRLLRRSRAKLEADEADGQHCHAEPEGADEDASRLERGDGGGVRGVRVALEERSVTPQVDRSQEQQGTEPG